MADRLLPLTDWALMFLGIVCVAVLLTALEVATPPRDAHEERHDDGP